MRDEAGVGEARQVGDPHPVGIIRQQSTRYSQGEPGLAASPAAVRVSNRVRARRRLASVISRARPRKLVSDIGRLFGREARASAMATSTVARMGRDYCRRSAEDAAGPLPAGRDADQRGFIGDPQARRLDISGTARGPDGRSEVTRRA